MHVVTLVSARKIVCCVNWLANETMLDNITQVFCPQGVRLTNLVRVLSALNKWASNYVLPLTVRGIMLCGTYRYRDFLFIDIQDSITILYWYFNTCWYYWRIWNHINNLLQGNCWQIKLFTVYYSSNIKILNTLNSAKCQFMNIFKQIVHLIASQNLHFKLRLF